MSIHLRADGLNGQSADAGHQGWIDVIDFKWGTRRLVNSATSTSGNREFANAEISDLTFRKFVDSSSPQLFIEACCGKGKEMQLAVTKTGAGSGAETFLAYTLKNAIICDYSIEAVALTGSKVVINPRPVEKVTISFVAIETRYTAYDDGGIALPPVSVGFDSSTNKKS